MALQFPCPCGRQLQVSEDLAGKRVRCPSCQRVVFAPAGPVPQATLVDAPAVPVVEARAQGKGPEPVPVAVTPASPARACNPCSGGAVGGFVISLSSLVFGVVTVLGPITWIPFGLIGAAVSCGALRRIRTGQAPAAGAGLARAGVAIGVGQALLAVLLWAGIATMCVKSGKCPTSRCGGPTIVPPHESRMIAPPKPPAQVDGVGEKEGEESEEGETDR
ncbi:MAG: hypothetical protein HYY18_00725 [Planctomycetes bacterium]|nr:hypothetical protein [Planctomycetota bacterium]